MHPEIVYMLADQRHRLLLDEAEQERRARIAVNARRRNRLNGHIRLRDRIALPAWRRDQKGAVAVPTGRPSPAPTRRPTAAACEAC